MDNSKESKNDKELSFFFTEQKTSNNKTKSGEDDLIDIVQISKQMNIVQDFCWKKLPKLNLRQIQEALKRNIINIEESKKLLIDPNKYSIFFKKIDVNSPLTKKALKNLEIDNEELILLDFSDFKSETLPEIYQIINFLLYLSAKYELLKAVLEERNRIKNLNREVKKRFGRGIFSEEHLAPINSEVNFKEHEVIKKKIIFKLR